MRYGFGRNDLLYLSVLAVPTVYKKKLTSISSNLCSMFKFHFNINLRLNQHRGFVFFVEFSNARGGGEFVIILITASPSDVTARHFFLIIFCFIYPFIYVDLFVCGWQGSSSSKISGTKPEEFTYNSFN